MSVEDKIKQLLNRTGGQLNEATDGDQTPPMQGSSQKASSSTIADVNAKPAVNTSKDTSKSGIAASSGDTSQPMQGSSKKADSEELDKDAPGKTASAKATKEANPLPMNGDAKSVKVPAMEEDEQDGETISEVDIHTQLNSIFGEDLSEEFKSKATSIFEAAVIARVNSEMDKVTAKLEEQASEQLQEFKDTIVEKVDGYLNYVVEQWMEENALAVEKGLRTEIAEDFISGLQKLFTEHYIEVPEDKYDVLEDLQSKAEELEEKLNEAIDQNVSTSKELAELKAAKIIEEQTKGLASTEVEKLKKLVEGVDFESEELYREKVSVIKENYFPKKAPTSPEKVLVEESGTNQSAFNTNDTMSRYVQALSRTVKSR